MSGPTLEEAARAAFRGCGHDHSRALDAYRTAVRQAALSQVPSRDHMQKVAYERGRAVERGEAQARIELLETALREIAALASSDYRGRWRDTRATVEDIIEDALGVTATEAQP